MKENEFQKAVLIPLFRAMGFNDVTAFGGGNLERGKDLVMWKMSDFGQRLNYGVVVKAKKITGNAETNTGAMNVLNQVRQMLKTTYLNPVNGDTERVKRCIVACSREITKEAMNSIEGELVNDLDKLVEWVHPETNLFQLIEKYLPEQNVFEQLSSIQSKLDEAMKIVPYRIIASSNNNFSIVGKHEKASEELPFQLKAKVKFDTTTPEGMAALAKFKNHFATGAPVEIEGKFIEAFDLPDFIPELMKPQITDEAKLIFEQHRSDETIPLRIERTLKSGEVFTSDRLEFQFTQQGTEEVTLKNDKQKTPFQVTLTLNVKKMTVNFNFSHQLYGFNVLEHLRSLRLFTSMSRDGKTDIYRADSGLRAFESYTGKIDLKESFESDLRILEDLVLIQNKIPMFIKLEKDSLTYESKKNIFEVSQIIKKGKLNGTVPELIVISDLKRTEKIIDSFKDENLNFITAILKDGFNYNIFGNEINVGTAVISGKFFINNIDFENIKKKVELKQSEIEIRLKPENEQVIVDFLKWDCEDRHTRIKIKDMKN